MGAQAAYCIDSYREKFAITYKIVLCLHILKRDLGTFMFNMAAPSRHFFTNYNKINLCPFKYLHRCLVIAHQRKCSSSAAENILKSNRAQKITSGPSLKDFINKSQTQDYLQLQIQNEKMYSNHSSDDQSGIGFDEGSNLGDITLHHPYIDRSILDGQGRKGERFEEKKFKLLLALQFIFT